jgi:hypothetical protein
LGLFETGEVQIREHFAVKLLIMLDVRNLGVSEKSPGDQDFLETLSAY